MIIEDNKSHCSKCTDVASIIMDVMGYRFNPFLYIKNFLLHTKHSLGEILEFLRYFFFEHYYFYNFNKVAIFYFYPKDFLETQCLKIY